MMRKLLNDPFAIFVTKFLFLFGTFYGLFFLVIGLSSPENIYSPFVATYLDFVTSIKKSLMTGTKTLLGFFGYKVDLLENFVIKMKGGRGVFIARDCVGIGVYSFWGAYIIASHHKNLKRTLLWLVGGAFILWLINVARISLLLIFYNKSGSPDIFGLDHHTFFNIVAYGFIFLMIWKFNQRTVQ